MENTFSLHIPAIGFDMPITDLILDLEKLRYKDLSSSSTHEKVLMQIKQIFQMLESVGSSRIEGNNTTVLEYIESAKSDSLEYHLDKDIENILEIRNLEVAMKYIEDNIDDVPISLQLIRELHELAVQELSKDREGVAHPGEFRKQNVRISGSEHTPPDFTQVQPYMEELIDFVNENHGTKYDLLKIAIVHHRFVWIHPFENGNGRVVRLLTYALFLKNVFKSKRRIINPTAVFCSDRDAYYHYLSLADRGDDEGLIEWCQYMLEGLKQELEKLDKLADYDSLKSVILYPALHDALQRRMISQETYSILKLIVDKENQEFQSSDLCSLFPEKKASDRSRLIRSLLLDGLLMPIKENGRKYVIRLDGLLLRSIVYSLANGGFLPKGNL